MNHIIILAAGKGTRMGQEIAKTLTMVGNKPIIFHILANIKNICKKPTIVVGFKRDEIIKKVGKLAKYIVQDKQLGTGHAVLCSKEKLKMNKNKNVIVLPGDHPLITENTILNIIELHNKTKASITVGYINVPKFSGKNEIFYNCGRIIKDNNKNILDIIELKNANEKQKKIRDVNVSYYCFDAEWLWKNIEKIKQNKKTKEYQLTDLIKIAVKNNKTINGFKINNLYEGMGINTIEQRNSVEQFLKKIS